MTLNGCVSVILVCCMTNLSSVRQHCMVVSKVACNVLVK